MDKDVQNSVDAWEFSPRACGFLFVGVEAAPGARGLVFCTIDGKQRAACSAHENHRGDEFMESSSFCVPAWCSHLSVEARVSVPTLPLHVRARWLPLANDNWVMEEAVPRDTELIYTAETDGFLYGYMNALQGQRGKVTIEIVDGGTAGFRTCSMASVHLNPPSDRWVDANSVMLPVTKGAQYRATVDTFGSPHLRPTVQIFWTGLIPGPRKG